jgi:thiamine biosynthesis lipoprotein
MGSDAHLIVVGGPTGIIDQAGRRIDDLERRWSRFLDDSEISRLNRLAGRWVQVSPETVTLIRRALDAWRLSGGSFDPTVLGDMIRSGYDRSFDLLGPGHSAGRSLLGIGADEITIDGDRVRLAAGTGFDPGGIGKGLAADLVAAEVMAAGAEGACVNLGGDVRVTGAGPDGAEGACVNLGGDVRVTGAGPDGAAWTVAVEHPWSPEPLALLGLAEGAVATSTTLRRAWHIEGQPRHHLIDPQTGLPSDTDLTLATVVAADAWVAEVLAKAVLLAGSAHPFDIIGGTGAQALVVDRDGGITASAGFAAYLGGHALPAAIPVAADMVGSHRA